MADALRELAEGRRPTIASRELLLLTDADADKIDGLESGLMPAAESDCDEAPDHWYDFGRDPMMMGLAADDPCNWILGTHRPHWAFYGDARGPLFLSVRQISRRVTDYPAATVPVYLDSGGFWEITHFGQWTLTPEWYAAEVRRRETELGRFQWAAIQDWMCEPFALARTGLTIREHQRRTIENFTRLFQLAPEVRWLPALQGQTIADYLTHLDMYREAGWDLRDLKLVGVGSMCRRESSAEAEEILRTLHDRGLRLHAFGLKTGGLRRCVDFLESADSLAWSYGARRRPEDVADRRGEGRGANHAQNDQAVAEAYRCDMQAIIDDHQRVLAAKLARLHERLDIPARYDFAGW